MAVKSCGFNVALGASLEKHVVLTAARKGWRQTAAAAQFPILFSPLDEPPLLRFTTFCATCVIGIVAWS
ncbi:MAG TPA: hypothetical protein VGY56_12510 [Verrucomicrobiae bacterium]|nr:hypothetical protein [Verrucomicrobiae bacterium]